MTNRTLFSILCAMILFTAFYTGCSKSRSPLSPEQLEENWKQANPAPTFTPGPSYVLWKNGTQGLFKYFDTNRLGDGDVSTAVTDDISLDPSVLAVGNASFDENYLMFKLAPNSVDVSSFVPSGHVCFNLRMLTATADIRVEIIRTAFDKATYNLGSIDVQTGFQPYCLPISSFTVVGTNIFTDVDIPFALIMEDNTSRVDPAFYINDIRWTID